MSGRYRNNLFFGVLCSSYIALSGVSFAATDGQDTQVQKPTLSDSQSKQAVKKVTVESEENDSWYGKTVFDRPRADYTNEGARLGSFKINPTISTDETYSSNIYATSSNKVDDAITHVSPGAGIESDWSRHALKVNASGDLGFYSDHSHENYGDYNVGASGRLDLVRETFLLGSASSSHLHEDRGSPDSVTNSKNPTEYNQDNASISFIRSLRRVALKLDGDYTRYNYENGETNSGGIIKNTGRDRNEYKVTGRVGYEIIPEYEAFIRTSLNNRNYEDAVDASGINRDSSGYDVVAGTALNLGGKTKGEVFAGYMGQNYDSNVLKNISGAQFGGNILWNMTGLTSVKTGILRGVQETSLANSSGYIATQYNLGLEHEVLYNVLAGVNVSYETDDYENTSISAVTRNDDIAGAGAELRYLVNRNASVIGKYDYTNRNSNIAGQDYDRSVVSLGLKLEM